MKQNLVDQTCELLKWLFNYRQLLLLYSSSSSGSIPSCYWPHQSSDGPNRVREQLMSMFHKKN